jgi:hypothetical protein
MFNVCLLEPPDNLKPIVIIIFLLKCYLTPIFLHAVPKLYGDFFEISFRHFFFP